MTTVYILRDGASILAKGFSPYTPIGTQSVELIQYDEASPPSWLTERKDLLYWDNGVQLKTLDMLKLEKLTFLQQQTLNMLSPINIAIASQTAANLVKVKKLKPEVFTISEDDIEAFGDYQNEIATFHLVWDPNDYPTLDDINIGIFNGGTPELPDFIKRLLNGG